MKSHTNALHIYLFLCKQGKKIKIKKKNDVFLHVTKNDLAY
jgi:hypothetical protein